jgi:hypothetical protein
MKYQISESQYNKLISKITGKKGDENFISKIKNFLSLNKDRSVGLMILQSVEEGNYELDNINSGSAKFDVNDFPIEVSRINGYHLYLPMVSEEPLKVGRTICKQIFYTIAEKHMDSHEYLKIWGEDHFDEI